MGWFLIDEGAARDPNHPAHDHRGLMAFATMVLFWIGGFVGYVSIDLPWLPARAAGLLIAFGGVGLGALIFWAFTRMRRRRAKLVADEYRALREAETDRKLAEARRAGIIR